MTVPFAVGDGGCWRHNSFDGAWGLTRRRRRRRCAGASLSAPTESRTPFVLRKGQPRRGSQPFCPFQKATPTKSPAIRTPPEMWAVVWGEAAVRCVAVQWAVRRRDGACGVVRGPRCSVDQQICRQRVKTCRGAVCVGEGPPGRRSRTTLRRVR